MEERKRLQGVALENVANWKAQATQEPQGKSPLVIKVLPDDWGVAAQAATKEYGKVFACLNMASAYVLGGGYLKGTGAQEENMFRRTDCHFSDLANLKQSQEIEFEKVVFKKRFHTDEEKALVCATEGKVYLDVTPRVCIKGPEDSTREDLGYALLEESQIFPFYELRAAALDLRAKKSPNALIDPEKIEAATRIRIKAQLNTLKDNNIRHVVLSAFGCGVYKNSAKLVARVYHEEIRLLEASFDVIIFAVFYPGYGPDNHVEFASEFQGDPQATKAVSVE